MDEEATLARKLAVILPVLNERQRRVVLGAEARALGHGGITRVARAAHVSRTTVPAALAAVDAAETAETIPLPSGRPTGGRVSAGVPRCEAVARLRGWGGSNGTRVRLWTVAVQALANETGVDISVCHLPPGTSKWNIGCSPTLV